MNKLQFLLILICFNTIACNCINKGKAEPKVVNKLITKEDTSYSHCFDGTQYEMTICAFNEFRYYDSILKTNFSELINTYDAQLKIQANYSDSIDYLYTKELKESVITSQHSWEILKENNSTVQAVLYKGGTMEHMMINIQMIIDTKARINYISNLLNE